MTFGFGMGFPRASSAAGGPSLNLQFAGATTLDPSITFTRASSGSYYDSTGILRLADTNEPRLDYNPSTLQPQGLLIEESRTNLLTYSSEFDNAAWTKIDTTVAANAAISPSGGNDATLLTQGVTGTSELWQTNSITAGAILTGSRYIKKGSAQWYVIQIRNGGATSFTYAWFDLTNGVVGSTSSSGGFATLYGSTISSVGDGWFRATFTVMLGASFTSALLNSFSVSADGSFVTVSNATRYEWGAQLEAGAFPTSYIPTVAAAATRAQDFASVTTLTPWYNATEGTLMAVAIPSSPVTSTIKILAAFDDGTFAQRAQIVKTSGTSFVNGVVTVGTAVYTGSVTTPWAIDTIGKAALAYKSSDNKIAFNGVLDTVATSTAGVPTVTKLAIGARYDGGTPWSGAISAITYYPRRLSDTELQSITA